MTISHRVSAQDAIALLSSAIRELETHPERFVEYCLRIDPEQDYPRLRMISVTVELPADAAP